MKKAHNKNEFLGRELGGFKGDGDGEKYLQKHRGQPRKTGFTSARYAVEHDDAYDDGDTYPAHRREPAKNLMRVQLRRIQQLF